MATDKNKTAERDKHAAEQAQSDGKNGNAGAETAGKVAVDAAELEGLRKRAAERDEFLTLAQRTQAEFQNYQKRTQREREQDRQFYTGMILKDLLPVLDNLGRALDAAKKAGESGALVQGVGMVQHQFLELLRKNGVERIPAEGRPFDPAVHEALTSQPSADRPADTVLFVVEPGYKIGDRVLRPAKVVVSSGAP